MIGMPMSRRDGAVQIRPYDITGADALVAKIKEGFRAAYRKSALNLIISGQGSALTSAYSSRCRERANFIPSTDTPVGLILASKMGQKA